MSGSSLDSGKVELLCLAAQHFTIDSLCDIGGVWGVDGGYSIYAKNVIGIPKVRLIDSHWTESAKRLCADAGVQIEESFCSDSLEKLKDESWDAVCLFHFLLHQVSPDWREILRSLAPSVDYFLINNPQWTNGKMGFRLLDEGIEKYFSYVPHQKTEESYAKMIESPHDFDDFHQKANRDLHHIWQWAITNDDLFDCMNSLGFSLKYMRPSTVWEHNENFQDFGFIFEKDS